MYGATLALEQCQENERQKVHLPADFITAIEIAFLGTSMPTNFLLSISALSSPLTATQNLAQRAPFLCVILIAVNGGKMRTNGEYTLIPWIALPGTPLLLFGGNSECHPERRCLTQTKQIRH